MFPLVDLYKPSVSSPLRISKSFSTPSCPGNQLKLKLTHQILLLKTTTKFVFPSDLYHLRTFCQAQIGPETLEPFLLYTLQPMCRPVLTFYSCGCVAKHHYDCSTERSPIGPICLEKAGDSESLSWLSYMCDECKVLKGWRKALGKLRAGRRKGN